MYWKEFEEAYKKSDIKKLFQLCEKELKVNPQSLPGKYYTALAYRKQGELLDAVAILDDMVRENPNEADFWAERGVTFLHLQNKERALEDFNMALSLDSDNGYRYSSRAFARAHFKDINGAIEDYKKALEIDPEDIASLNNLGLLEEQQGRKDNAKELYSRADEAAGVKHTDQEKFKEIAAQYNQEQQVAEEVDKPKLTFSYYTRTAKELLFTKNGRKEFLNFFKEKLNKKQ